jgi:hypothetical protein
MRRSLMASMLLVVFALHAFVPSGFMPAKGRPFLLEICDEDLPADLAARVNPSSAHSMDMASMDMDAMPAENSILNRVAQQRPHHHGGSSSRGEHCVFASACIAGPIPHWPTSGEISRARPLRAVALAAIAVAVRVVHLPQPRAPPSQLS